MECWLITSRSEVRRLNLEEPPEEICLPDKPLTEIDDDAAGFAIQDSPYIIYKRFDIPGADETSPAEVVYAVREPSVSELQLIAAISDREKGKD